MATSSNRGRNSSAGRASTRIEANPARVFVLASTRRAAVEDRQEVRVTRIGLACLVLAGLAVSSAASATTIADIVADPEGYSGQQVTVVGTVADPKAAYAGETVYTLSSGDRRITVFGRGAAPTAGDQVQVNAKVGWREGDEEFTWPPILFESSRQPAP
jgi:hypothetical protein